MAMNVSPAFSISLGLRPAARAYWAIFSQVVGNSGIAELPQMNPLAQLPARLRATSALPPVKIGIGFWIGRGPSVRFCTLKNLPLYVTLSSVHWRFMN